MKKTLLISILTILPLTTVKAWDLNLATGSTSQGQLTTRIGLSQDWGVKWLESNTGHVTGYWDLGLTRWESGKYNKTRYNLSASPVFVYQFSGDTYKPFIEAGIGLAAFNGTRVGDRKISTKFQFEDRLGVGVKINNRHTLGVRAIHYSNASIKRPNQGVENYHLFYQFKF